MKIRLMGSLDLLKKWGNELKAEYGISGKLYKNHNSHEYRYYVDLDDRQAERIVERNPRLEKK